MRASPLGVWIRQELVVCCFCFCRRRVGRGWVAGVLFVLFSAPARRLSCMVCSPEAHQKGAPGRVIQLARPTWVAGWVAGRPQGSLGTLLATSQEIILHGMLAWGTPKKCSRGGSLREPIPGQRSHTPPSLLSANARANIGAHMCAIEIAHKPQPHRLHLFPTSSPSCKLWTRSLNGP